MTNEDLIKNYKQLKFKIEEDINKEEDNLTRFQIKKDDAAVNACRERLSHLYSELKRADDMINQLMGGQSTLSNVPVPSPTTLPDLTKGDVPIDDGTVETTMTFTNTQEGTVNDNGKKNYQTHVQTTSLTRTTVYKEGEIISDITEQHSSSKTEIRKDESIEIKAKRLK